MTISESRCQRVSVRSTDKKIVSDKIIGRNRTILNPSMVVIASFGIQPLAAIRTKKPARCATTMPMSIKNAAAAVEISSLDNDLLKIFNLHIAL
jgi:hypothetical protein